MIKNIVFDLGNVLISFKPSEFFDKKNYPENIKITILSDIFRSREWAILDNGEINTQEAINAIALKSSLNKEEITHIFNLRSELIFPIDSNVSLLPELKKRGYRLFFLSNFPMDLFEEVKTGYYFFKYFDGGTISAEAKSSKPDSVIFEFFLKKHSLIPDECLFIDDLEINVSAGEKFGMKGLVTFGSESIMKEIENALK
ncbi:MAG: HAD family phosphatase [Bacteroidetes bacterium]|nr:MAG: HAD family phosphatase [Bacteroidota bacterium]